MSPRPTLVDQAIVQTGNSVYGRGTVFFVEHFPQIGTASSIRFLRLKLDFCLSRCVTQDNSNAISLLVMLYVDVGLKLRRENPHTIVNFYSDNVL